MLDTEGWVVEGTMSNVFAVRKDELLTPDLAQCGVDGIVRGLIIDLARTRNDMKLRVESMGLETLLGADEAFLCNSLIGIWPLNRVGERTFSVGPVSQYYQKALLEQGSIVRKQDSLVI